MGLNQLVCDIYFFSNLPGHILDLYCIQLSNAAPFCENYAKLYFDAKHLENRLNRGAVKFWGPFFKKVPFFHKSALSGQYEMLP